MRRNQRSPGFSLILSLTVMAGIVMLLVTVSAFITVESRAVMNQQLAVRAKLNGIVSMRLALAHLQQEAGPDRRSTARADITQPAASASTVLNPMWTGIWRTDLPDLPPAWIVSGRADQPAGTQSVSLFQSGASPDYHAGYWAPWQGGYTPGADALVNLVGTGSAAASEGSRPSGLVALPKVALPDDRIKGTYAYWVGDEGIKARINLRDVRSPDDTNNADQMISLRSPLTPGYALVDGLGLLTNPSQLTSLDSVRQLPLLSGYENTTGGRSTPNARLLFHDITGSSAGVLADSLNGGLKRDLSAAFELSDAQFAATEFGQGVAGAAATTTEKGVEAAAMPVLTQGSKTTAAAPVFSRTVADGQVRGPTWWALRDYHRLYKQLGWTSSATSSPRSTGTPTLKARTLWPNVAAAHPSGPPASSGLPNNSLRNRLYGYSDVYDGDLPATSGNNPNANDYRNGSSSNIVTRPLNVAATPYLQRVTLAFTVNKMQYWDWTLIRKGKLAYWSWDEWIDIRLNITPIVVIHNPFNVRMTWTPGAASGGPNRTPYAAAIGFSDMADWKFRFKQYKTGTLASPYVYETRITDFFTRQATDSDNEDTFRFFLTKDASASITLEPGELRVFSCEPKISEWTKSIVLDNTYNIQGGYRDNVWDWNFGDAATFTFNIENPIGLEIIPGGNLRVRHALSCWPGDQLELNASASGNPAADKNDFLAKSSESSEISFNDIVAAKYPSPGERFFLSWRHVQDKYQRPNVPEWDGRNPYPTPTSPPLPADIVTVIDISAKTSDHAAAPYSTYTHSNPLAASQRPSAGGRIGSAGARGASPSYQLSVRTGSWDNVLENHGGGKLAFGGNSATFATGNARAILAEIPLVQPVSLAQYAHANFGVRDHQPLLSIGNSFASPLVDAGKALQDNGNNWTEYDQTYLLNAALWDGYFLSSVAPWMKAGTAGAITAPSPTPTDPVTVASKTYVAPTDPNEKKSMTQVISDFVNGGVPLDNPRFTLESGRDAGATAAALADYRRSAAVLLNRGAFNVNSTSVAAWTAFLGSAKNLAVADKAKTTPDATNNARFPRMLTKDTAAPAAGNTDNPSNWTGFANLSDTQIANLANAIVAENKARFGILTRSERELAKTPGPRLFGGLAKATTPYLGLSEFINRFLTSETWASRCGALQAAIFRADQTYNAGLSDRLFANAADRKLTQDSLKTATSSWFPNPENIELTAQTGTSRAHTSLGAPGNLLQSDLLQSLGSALATRSDTFTLRCYGEASLDNGEIGSAWVEVVVQRIPEFVDPTNPAETGNSAPKPLKIGPSLATDPTVSTALTPVNNVLGRRFKVVSMRWLKADEI